jgi:hypothetical protein
MHRIGVQFNKSVQLISSARGTPLPYNKADERGSKFYIISAFIDKLTLIALGHLRIAGVEVLEDDQRFG